MVRLVACVHDADEAAAALEHGFDGVLGAAAPAGRPGTPRLAGRLEGDVLILEGWGAPRRFAILRDTRPEDAMLDRLVAERHAGLLLTTAGRLIEAVPPADLARIAGRLAAGGLLTAFAGGIEAPDIPRLAAVGGDILLIGRALRRGRPLDGDAMRAVVRAASAGAEAAVPPSAARLDRIFVRDLVRTLAIGAYASERGREQRVRFTVEADILPVARAAETMADIVSYDLIMDAVAQAAEGSHVDLVETLAERVAGLLLRVPRIVLVRVRVEKLDLGPAAAGIEIERRKDSAGR